MVERSLPWITHARRNTRFVEHLIEHCEARIAWARRIRVVGRRLARDRARPEIHPPNRSFCGLLEPSASSFVTLAVLSL